MSESENLWFLIVELVGGVGIVCAVWSLCVDWLARYLCHGQPYRQGYAQCMRDAKRHGLHSPLLYMVPPVMGLQWLAGYNAALRELGLKEIGK